jgi:hypothetical protein
VVLLHTRTVQPGIKLLPAAAFALFTLGSFYLLVPLIYGSAAPLAGLLAVLGLAALLGGRQEAAALSFALPLAWRLWEASGRNVRQALSLWRSWLPLSLIPLSYLGWVGFRAFFLSDFNPDFSRFQAFVYSVFISSDAGEVVPVQAFLFPWQALRLGINQVIAAPDLDLVTNFILAGYFLILLVLVWSKMPLSERVYVAAITLVSFSYYTGPVHPYMGLPRHLLLAFPVFIGLGALITRPVHKMLLTVVNLFGFFILLGFYVLHVWVP